MLDHEPDQATDGDQKSWGGRVARGSRDGWRRVGASGDWARRVGNTGACNDGNVAGGLDDGAAGWLAVKC